MQSWLHCFTVSRTIRPFSYVNASRQVVFKSLRIFVSKFIAYASTAIVSVSYSVISFIQRIKRRILSLFLHIFRYRSLYFRVLVVNRNPYISRRRKLHRMRLHCQVCTYYCSIISCVNFCKNSLFLPFIDQFFEFYSCIDQYEVCRSDLPALRQSQSPIAISLDSEYHSSIVLRVYP